MAFMQRQMGIEGSFGPTLRELREQRGVSREELSEQTKIHISVITTLEEERISDLADPQYAERHVRSIVLALDGRLAYFLPKYRQLLTEKRASTSDTFSVRPKVRRRDLVVVTRYVALGGFLLLVSLFAAYLIWQGRLIQDAPPLLISSPAQDEALTEPSVRVAGTTAPGAVITVNGRRAVVDPGGGFYLTFDVPRGLTTLTIEAKRRYGAIVTDIRRVTYQHDSTSSTTSTQE